MGIDACINERNDICMGKDKMSLLGLGSLLRPDLYSHFRIRVQNRQYASISSWNDAHLHMSE